MTRDQKDGSTRRPSPIGWARVAGMEFEFAAGVVGCTLIGWWVDRTFGTGNKGIVTGAIVGCVGGMYHLIRRAFALQRRSGGDQERSADRKDDFDTPRGE